MEEHTTTLVRDSTDRSYQTNGPATELAEDRSEDNSRNGRSRTRTRKVVGRSSSSSRVETSSRTVNRVKEGPADIIGRGLDNRSSGTPATTRPHTQPVLSNKSSSSSKSQSSATRKLKTPSNSILPSKTIVPGSTRAATSTPTGGSIASSSRSKSGLQGAVGGVGVPGTTKSGKTKAHSVHAYKGVKVSVVHGDLTKEKVDVIVSSGGGDLKNLGGVAGAISRAGGPSIQEDCDSYKQRHGPLKTTECMVTGPGRLRSCNHVIHSCGPVYQRSHPHRTERELKDTTYAALMSAAVDLKAQSIALPAISSGTFRVPKDMCARAMLAGIMAFAEAQQDIYSGLQDIRIVDNDFYTVLGFSSQCGKLLDDPSNTRDSTTGSRRRSSSMSRAVGRGRTASFGQPSTSNMPAASASSFTNSSYQSLPSFHDKGDNHFRNERSWDHQNTSGMEYSSPKSQQSDRSKTSDGDQDDTCPICMSDFTDPKMLPCKHKFCSDCLATALKHAAKCPICGLVVGRLRGDQPEGRMEYTVERHSSLPGYPGCGTIIIHYSIPSGVQGRDHPNPGQPYHGTSRKAYLPDNYEGQEVLTLLKEAWRNKLVFTIGTSVTTGTDDAVTWNDIHHKTNRSGGPTRYGYPDPTYLARVKEELAAKGITTRPSTA
ncbi:E3 ubiquitin-protein ligase dtx3l [Branchiostoma belcheri]|nr:E3 ubiquitin-protein ligase dtx3l [Branchiostoma belcheri]